MPRSVSLLSVSSGLSRISGIASFGSTSRPFNFIVLGRSSALRNVEHGQLQRFAHLLRGKTDAVRRVHRLDHVGGQLADVFVDLLDPFAFRPQNRVAV